MKPFVKTILDLEQLPVEESLFTLGNGYLGIRGNFEEGYSSSAEEIRGAYLNGVYARIPVEYPESAFGFPDTADKQPRLFDAQTIHIFLDGEPVALDQKKYNDYSRSLDMSQGTSTRRFTYTTKSGKEASISFTRMVSLLRKELFAIHVDIAYAGEIHVESTLESDIENYTNKNDPRVAGAHAKLLTTTILTHQPLLFTQATVQNSDIQVACGVSHLIDVPTAAYTSCEDHRVIQSFVCQDHITFTKLAVYTDSLRHNNLRETTVQLLADAASLGWDALVQEQTAHYTHFWSTADILLADDEALQMTLRFAIYQLYQSVGKDKFSNISAKGLSGEGYEGHYFWDTEIYIFPYFLVTQPDIAKSLLTFRYRQLPQAKQEAANLGAHRGAKFPWRTISGIESSAYFPAGQAQYHINGDVAYSLLQYYFATDDTTFLREYGLEMLLEISLFFLEIGHFYEDTFHIDRVTGPDEYTAIVNNNYYTNALAQHTFRWTVKLMDELSDQQKHASLLAKTGATLVDLEQMERAACVICLPFDENLGIALQDDSFLTLRPWQKQDDKRPLLLHYHPLRIYSAQILKQADTVLAHFLLEDLATEDVIRNSYSYYEERTTHDSSLSSCLYGMMACRIGDSKKAKDYFLDSVYLDMNNTHKNTNHGLHMANLAGSSMYLLYGFGGLRIKENGVTLRPIRPEGFPAYAFQIQVKRSLLQVKVDKEITVTRLSGDLSHIKIYDENYSLAEPIVLPIALSKT